MSRRSGKCARRFAAEGQGLERGRCEDLGDEQPQVPKASVYTIGFKPGCDTAPMALPAGYDQTAEAAL